MNKEKNEKIYFILNTLGLTGGVRVIFEHANRLASKGYQVEIIHLLKLEKNLKGLVIAILKKIKNSLKNSQPNWFAVSEKIKIKHVISLKSLNIQEDGIVVATANETADFVNELKIKNKFYFIQDYEVWTRNKNLVDKTYQYNLKKIVISKHLKDVITSKFKTDILGIVPNGVDYNFFYIDYKTEKNTCNILMLYHPLPKKGFKHGIRAIEKLKETNKKIKLLVFGAYKIQKNKIIDEFFYKPDKKTIKNLYQQADIFLYPALEEGFGLTLLEAAAAKCALVTTNVGWIYEHGKNNENVILINKGDYKDIVNKLEKIIKNDTEIKILGEKISLCAQNFTWENSNDQLEKILISKN